MLARDVAAHDARKRDLELFFALPEHHRVFPLASALLHLGNPHPQNICLLTVSSYCIASAWALYFRPQSVTSRTDMSTVWCPLVNTAGAFYPSW